MEELGDQGKVVFNYGNQLENKLVKGHNHTDPPMQVVSVKK